jgi:hypothetical protein
MQFDVAALPAEDLEPLAKALSLAPPEKRGEVYMRIQNAGREFLAKATAGKPPSAATETDAIKGAVVGELTKQLPAPAPQLDPLKREALGSMEKAVMAGIRGAARGVVDAMGVTGRSGAMRQMRGAYKAGYRSDMLAAKDRAIEAARKASGAYEGIGAKARAHDRAFDSSLAAGENTARMAGRIRANTAGNQFSNRRKLVIAGAGVGAFEGAAYLSRNRPRKQKDQ